MEAATYNNTANSHAPFCTKYRPAVITTPMTVKNSKNFLRAPPLSAMAPSKGANIMIAIPAMEFPKPRRKLLAVTSAPALQ